MFGCFGEEVVVWLLRSMPVPGRGAIWDWNAADCYNFFNRTDEKQ
ncbi:hypothetical protein [Companilactobacillus furfuricola]|nr:hypothetical protein [Companilactobacillus furfuricola]